MFKCKGKKDLSCPTIGSNLIEWIELEMASSSIFIQVFTVALELSSSPFFFKMTGEAISDEIRETKINVVSSSTSVNKALNVRPSESPIFHAIMAIICASIAGILMWAAINGIDPADPDHPIGLAIIFFSTSVTVVIACYFGYLSILAFCYLFTK